MVFPFALSRLIVLSNIIVTNTVLLVLSAISFHEKTGGAFQALTICFTVFTLIIIIGCFCHRLANRDEEACNIRNLGLFSFCALIGFASAASLTVHARQDHGAALCHDFANAGSPCVPAGVQLGMAYVSSAFALAGVVISWIDKFPGAVRVTARYPITKAPSSQFGAYAHDLDGIYPRPPTKMPSRQRNNADWSDIPLS